MSEVQADVSQCSGTRTRRKAATLVVYLRRHLLPLYFKVDTCEAPILMFQR